MPYHRPGEYAKCVEIRKEITANLRSKLSLSESRHDAKIQKIDHHGIYSTKTFETYNEACQNFASHVIKESPTGHNTSLREAFKYAKGFIEKEINAGKSPYTIKMERSALAKLFSCRGKDIYEYVPQRARENITRSRNRTVISEKTGKEISNQSTRAGHFSEKNNKDIVDFARGTGLRRSELASVRGSQLIEAVSNNKKVYGIKLHGSQCKGGRARVVYIRGENAERIANMMKAAGDNKVFETVPKAMDVHHYRAQYASDLYKELARPIDQVPKNERYCCRGDLRGTWYDKEAMKSVSQCLGHNRISVIAEHYLR